MKIHIVITNEQGKSFEGNAELFPSKKQLSKAIKSVSQDKKTPSSQIRQLYLSSFFKQQKKLGDVSKILKSKGFNFKPGSIQWALDQADYLDRSGNKGNYRWIQKYPPS